MISTPLLKNVSITELGFSGDGCAREGDQIIFVPFGLPGDQIQVQVMPSTKSGPAFARIIDLITPSPDRVLTPPCIHCFDCGGCSLQHFRTQAYQAWKQQSVMGRLMRAGLTPEQVSPLKITLPGSRRRATFCARRSKGKVTVGFNRNHSDHVVDLQECHIVVPGIVSILADLRVLMGVLLGDLLEADVSVVELDTGLDILITGEIQLDLIKREAIADFTRIQNIARVAMRSRDRAEIEVVLQPKPTRVTVGGIVIDPVPGCFLQPSRAGEDALITAVLDGVQPMPGEKIIDLFAGMGTFTYPLARAGAHVRAVDVDVYQGAVAWPVAAGRDVLPGVVTSEARNLYKAPVRAEDLRAYGAIIFDPPRAGAKGQAVEIMRSDVDVIVAVSCNPASFITDCTPFLRAGYVFEKLTIVDQFLWSAHVELVGIFRKH